MPGAGLADQRAHLGVGIEHGLGSVEDGLLAAAHDAELPIHRACLAAGHRCIDEADALVFRLLMDFTRHRRRRGRVVDEDRAFLHAGENPVVAIDHRAHIVVVADAHHDEVAVLGCLARRRRVLAAVFFRPLLGLRRGAVVHRDIVAAFLEQVAGHRVAHDAQAEERDFRHRYVS